MRSLVTAFLKDETGASAVEYTILIALIAGAIVAAVGPLGTKMAAEFRTITGQVP